MRANKQRRAGHYFFFEDFAEVFVEEDDSPAADIASMREAELPPEATMVTIMPAWSLPMSPEVPLTVILVKGVTV